MLNNRAMKKTGSFLCFICMCLFSKAQDISKSKIKVLNNSYDYYEMQADLPVKGLLILLPAFGEKPKSIFTKTNLPKLITAKGYITLAVEVPQNMFANNDCIAELNQLIKLKIAQYKLSYSDVIIGGLSNGGAISLCYAEYLNSQATPIKLKAVFAVDPPADLTRIYASGQKESNYQCPLIAREGKSGVTYLENVLGGSPAINPGAYVSHAVYSANEANGGKAKFLNNLPVRLYSEPDLEYVQKTYCAELQYFNLNAYDLEKLIIFLKGIGNNQAEYITTKGKGFHSWNIIDAENCADWIISL